MILEALGEVAVGGFVDSLGLEPCRRQVIHRCWWTVQGPSSKRLDPPILRFCRRNQRPRPHVLPSTAPAAPANRNRLSGVMKLERQLKIALDESRLLILGTQVLFGF